MSVFRCSTPARITVLWSFVVISIFVMTWWVSIGVSGCFRQCGGLLWKVISITSLSIFGCTLISAVISSMIGLLGKILGTIYARRICGLEAGRNVSLILMFLNSNSIVYPSYFTNTSAIPDCLLPPSPSPYLLSSPYSSSWLPSWLPSWLLPSLPPQHTSTDNTIPCQ